MKVLLAVEPEEDNPDVTESEDEPEMGSREAEVLPSDSISLMSKAQLEQMDQEEVREARALHFQYTSKVTDSARYKPADSFIMMTKKNDQKPEEARHVV